MTAWPEGRGPILSRQQPETRKEFIMTRTPNTKAPQLIAWHVPERENAPWTRIGAAWRHDDRKGFSLQLELMPTAGGRIVLRANEPKPTPEGGA
jgi:hypothetical protein